MGSPEVELQMLVSHHVVLRTKWGPLKEQSALLTHEPWLHLQVVFSLRQGLTLYPG